MPSSLPDLEVQRHALAQVESGDNPLALGKKGEGTRYQILGATWVRYSTQPMYGCSEHEAARVADAILLDIAKELARRQLPRTPYTMAVMWREGLHAKPTLNADIADYAARVSNLYDEEIRRK